MNSTLFGWRARLGIIYPESGLADMEYYHLAPAGVSVHITRTSMADEEGSVTLETMTQVAGGERFDALAASLSSIKPHALCWMCTSGSFSRGPLWDETLRNILSTHGGCPATTTSTAMVTALNALGTKNVALGTPYEPRLNQKLVEYVNHFGFTVVNQVGLNLTLDWDIGRLGPEELRNLVMNANVDDAEAVFISDTGIILSPIVQSLEDDLGKPVISANMVSMWHMLRMAGIREPQPGLGRLFQLRG